MQGALAALFSFVYQAPALLGPGFEHWPLTPEQAAQLATATNSLLRSLPRRSKESTIRALSRWVPWLTFGSTVVLITWPRVMMSANAMRAQRAGVYRDRLAGDGSAPRYPAPGAGGVSQDGGADGGPARVHTWADLRGAGAG